MTATLAGLALAALAALLAWARSRVRSADARIGAGVDAGLAAVGGSLVAGLGLAADTERVVRRATVPADVEGPPA